MNDRRKQSAHLRLIPIIGLLVAMCVTAMGCVNLAANLIHAVQGNDRPAEFDGFKDKRVAVICSSESGLIVDATNSILTNNIHAALGMNVKDIELVRSSEIEQWLDVHGWSENDYLEIGQGVKADLLLAIEVMNLKLQDGQTLYRGQADIDVTVYDMSSNGKILYRKQIPEFSFPSTAGIPVIEISENKFRSYFLEVLTNKVAGLFYAVDATADYALDATASRF